MGFRLNISNFLRSMEERLPAAVVPRMLNKAQKEKEKESEKEKELETLGIGDPIVREGDTVFDQVSLGLILVGSALHVLSKKDILDSWGDTEKSRVPGLKTTKKDYKSRDQFFVLAGRKIENLRDYIVKEGPNFIDNAKESGKLFFRSAYKYATDSIKEFHMFADKHMGEFKKTEIGSRVFAFVDVVSSFVGAVGNRVIEFTKKATQEKSDTIQPKSDSKSFEESYKKAQNYIINRFGGQKMHRA